MRHSKHGDKKINGEYVYKLLLHREQDDINLMRRSFCHANIDSNCKTGAAKVYIIDCTVNINHSSHVVQPATIRTLKRELTSSAIKNLNKLVHKNNLSKTETIKAKELVHSNYLKKFNYFGKELKDKEVLQYLKNRNNAPVKTTKNLTRKKPAIKLAQIVCNVVAVNDDIYEITTAYQTQVLTEIQIKEFFSCYTKRTYLTAKEALSSESSSSDASMSEYLCVFCSGYHLGHKKAEGKRLPFQPANKFSFRYKLRPALGEDFLEEIAYTNTQPKYVIY